MNILPRQKIVLLGMMSHMPVAGVVWQTVQYLVGFERLGYETYYVEAHGCTPSVFMNSDNDDGEHGAATFIDRVMRRFDLGGRWAYHAVHASGRCHGLEENRLKALYQSAALIVNLHGGTIPLPEHSAGGRLVFLETDPVELQMQLHQNRQEAIDYLQPHCAFFTFGENYGRPGCKLPVAKRFHFLPTRQPVVLDFWYQGSPSLAGRVGVSAPTRLASEDTPAGEGAGQVWTTVGNWRQQHRDVCYQGEVYRWSKHYEFLKFLDLPRRSGQQFELALSGYSEADGQLLEKKGWRVRAASALSADIDAYRDYITGSRGEFTVAKDQNVRLRTGWFSDRSAAYLAAGRPVITQETGFSDFLPAGRGLFGFNTMEEILAALDRINSDYRAASREAREIARAHFAAERVLQHLVERVQ
jgi:hypothetical protein